MPAIAQGRGRVYLLVRLTIPTACRSVCRGRCHPRPLCTPPPGAAAPAGGRIQRQIPLPMGPAGGFGGFTSLYRGCPVDGRPRVIAYYSLGIVSPAPVPSAILCYHGRWGYVNRKICPRYPQPVPVSCTHQQGTTAGAHTAFWRPRGAVPGPHARERATEGRAGGAAGWPPLSRVTARRPPPHRQTGQGTPRHATQRGHCHRKLAGYAGHFRWHVGP